MSGRRLCVLRRHLCADAAEAVPVVDVSPLLSGSTNRASVEAIRSACSASGFLARGHGLDADILDALGAMRAFFDSDGPLKLRHKASKARKGFTPVGSAKISIRPSTLHERYQYPHGRSLRRGDALRVPEARECDDCRLVMERRSSLHPPPRYPAKVQDP